MAHISNISEMPTFTSTYRKVLIYNPNTIDTYDFWILSVHLFYVWSIDSFRGTNLLMTHIFHMSGESETASVV